MTAKSQLQKLLSLTQQSASSSAISQSHTPTKKSQAQSNNEYTSKGYVPPSVQQRRWAPGSRALPVRKRSDGGSTLTASNWPPPPQQYAASSSNIAHQPSSQPQSQPAAPPQAPSRQEKALPVRQPHCPAKPDQIGPLIGKPQRGTPASTPYKQSKPTAPGSFAARTGGSGSYGSTGGSTGSALQLHAGSVAAHSSSTSSANAQPHSPTYGGVGPEQPSADVPLLSGTLRERAALTSHRFYLQQSGPWASGTPFVTENHAASRRFGDRSAYTSAQAERGGVDSTPAASTPRQGARSVGWAGLDSPALSHTQRSQAETPMWAHTARTSSSVQSWTGRSDFSSSPAPPRQGAGGGDFLQPAPPGAVGAREHKQADPTPSSGSSFGALHSTGHTPLAHHLHSLSPQHERRDAEVRAAVAVVTGVAASTARSGHVHAASTSHRGGAHGVSHSTVAATGTAVTAALHNSPSAVPGNVGVVGNSAKASLLAMRTAEAMLLQQKAAASAAVDSDASSSDTPPAPLEGGHLFRSFSHRVPPSLQHVATAAAAASSAVHYRSPSRGTPPADVVALGPIAPQQHIQPHSPGVKGVQATIGLTVLGPSPTRTVLRSAQQAEQDATPPTTPMWPNAGAAPKAVGNSPGVSHGISTSPPSAPAQLSATDSAPLPASVPSAPAAGQLAVPRSVPSARVITLPGISSTPHGTMPEGVFHPSQRSTAAQQPRVHEAAAASLQRYAAAPSKTTQQPTGSMTAEQISAMLDAASSRVLALQAQVPTPSGSRSYSTSVATSASTSPSAGYAGQLGQRHSAAGAVAAAPTDRRPATQGTSSDTVEAAARGHVSFEAPPTAQQRSSGTGDSTAALKERLAALHGHLQSL